MVEKKKYPRQKHLNNVIDYSGARYSVQSILLAMCLKSDFDGPTVAITKQQLCWLVGGLHRVHIIKGLRWLRDHKVITVLENGKGGSKKAVVYRLNSLKPKFEYTDEQDEPTAESRMNADKASAIMKEYGFKR